MLQELKSSLLSQFGASIDMLENVIGACPPDYYQSQKRFFYLAYHSVVFLDYYLTFPPKNFGPLLPFSIQDPQKMPPEALGDILPDKMYTQETLQDYLSQIRLKSQHIIAGLSEKTLPQRFIEGTQAGDMNYSRLEILLYNLRHTQHHVGQLNMLLRQAQAQVPPWVFRAGETS